MKYLRHRRAISSEEQIDQKHAAEDPAEEDKDANVTENAAKESEESEEEK